MRIYIPSKGRAGRVRTLNSLSKKQKDDTLLVVYKDEAKAYEADHDQLLICPKWVKGIGDKRHFIMETHAKLGNNPALIMMDDDLQFAVRRTDDPGKALGATTKDVDAMIREIGILLKNYAHVGVVPREGFNRFADAGAVIHNTRMQRVLGMRADVFKAEKIDYRRVPFIEDFDVVLQLLRKGYSNAVLTKYIQGQGSSNAPGGCSDTRTLEIQGERARLLQSLHPEFIRLVEKTTKTAWGGGTRTDVNISWKKAFESAGCERKVS